MAICSIYTHFHLTNVRLSSLNEQTLNKIRHITRSIANALYVTGPFNMQLIAKDNDLQVREVFRLIGF